NLERDFVVTSRQVQDDPVLPINLRLRAAAAVAPPHACNGFHGPVIGNLDALWPRMPERYAPATRVAIAARVPKDDYVPAHTKLFDVDAKFAVHAALARRSTAVAVRMTHTGILRIAHGCQLQPPPGRQVAPAVTGTWQAFSSNGLRSLHAHAPVPRAHASQHGSSSWPVIC